MDLSAQRHGPAAAAEQAKQLIPHPGLQATLFASEPMLLNPANMDIDAEGRVWTSNSNAPTWQIERGQPRVIRLDPRTRVRELAATP